MTPAPGPRDADRQNAMRRASFLIGAVAAVIALGGCTAVPPAREPEPSASPSAEAVAFSMADFCSGVSRVASAVWNADAGYRGYGLTAQKWAERMAQALRLADELVAASPAGELRAAAEDLRDAVAAGLAPPTGDIPDNYALVQPIFSRINKGAGGCVENGTEAPIMAEYGG